MSERFATEEKGKRQEEKQRKDRPESNSCCKCALYFGNILVNSISISLVLMRQTSPQKYFGLRCILTAHYK